MKVNVENLERSELKKYKDQGYILFDRTVYVDDFMDEKELFLAYEGDIISYRYCKVIGLNEINEDHLVFEIFDGENYSLEEIFDKIGEFISFEVIDSKILKTVFRFRRDY